MNIPKAYSLGAIQKNVHDAEKGTTMNNLIDNIEKHKIRELAGAHGEGNTIREECVTIFHNFLEKVRINNINHGDWPVEMKFMSEVDNPVPDFNLRSMYRQQILEKESGNA